jgi:hypothetical protein
VGASWVRKNILERFPDAPLSVYAVWVTKLGASRDDIDLDLFGDDRVTSYWDPEGLVGDAILDDAGADWDVYALYDGAAGWDAAPVDTGAPVIADAERLRASLERLLT